MWEYRGNTLYAKLSAINFTYIKMANGVKYYKTIPLVLDFKKIEGSSQKVVEYCQAALRKYYGRCFTVKLSHTFTQHGEEWSSFKLFCVGTDEDVPYESLVHSIGFINIIDGIRFNFEIILSPTPSCPGSYEAAVTCIPYTGQIPDQAKTLS